MPNNPQALKDLISGVQQSPILQANEPDELRFALKDALKDYLNSFQERWDQCAQMEKTVADDDNSAYKKLSNKIQVIIAKNKWFYIGYTDQDLCTKFYLWNSEPKNEIFNTAVANHHLVKSYTYYTTLQGTMGESEDALITDFHQQPGCLNFQVYGKKETFGIVYVLVYEGV